MYTPELPFFGICLIESDRNFWSILIVKGRLHQQISIDLAGQMADRLIRRNLITRFYAEIFGKFPLSLLVLMILQFEQVETW